MKNPLILALPLIFAVASAPVHADFEFRSPKSGVTAPEGGESGGGGGGGAALTVSVTQDPARLLNDAASYSYSGGVFLQDHLAGALSVSGGTGPYTYQWATVEWAPITGAQCNTDTTDYIGMNCTYEYGAWTPWTSGDPVVVADMSGLSYPSYCESDDYDCYDLEPINLATETNPFFSANGVGGSMYVFQVRVTVTDSLSAQAISDPITIIYPGY